MSGIAGVFAGQGAQNVGMGSDLAQSLPACRQLYDRASEVLGYDLAEICFNGPVEKLTASDVCQPAIFVTSVACRRALAERRPNLPWKVLAGLSLGEWTALHTAGVLDFTATVDALRARGQYMQEACEQNPGGMLSIMDLPPEKIEEICATTGLTVANLNSRQQTVLSGPREAIDEAAVLAREKGAKRALPLKVAGAFHSPLMQPARDKFARFLANLSFAPPTCLTLSNVTGQPHPADGNTIRETMLRQITEPVRWLDNVLWCVENGIDTYIEMGPGKVLTGLIRRTDDTAKLINIQGAGDTEGEI